VQPQYRLLAIGLVLLVTAGFGVHYGAAYEDNWPHPTADELAEDRGAYDGEQVLLIGEVTEIGGDDGLTMMLETSAGEEIEIEVRGVKAAVEPGGVVQVYGTLAEGGTIQQADRTVVVNEDSADGRYKLGVSGIAGLLTAGLFLYYWRIDIREPAFEVRDG
jgi:hypothetical protein